MDEVETIECSVALSSVEPAPAPWPIYGTWTYRVDPAAFEYFALAAIADISGTPGDDTIGPAGIGPGVSGLPSDGQDSISSGDGNDLIESAGGDDTVLGGQGNDSAFGGDGHDRLDAQGSGGGADSLSGGAGNDTLYGSGADTLRGGEGDDLIEVRSVVPVDLQGGNGIDTLRLRANLFVQGAFGAAASGIETIEGNGFRVYGGAGADHIDLAGIAIGLLGAIHGQDGNDSLGGGTASDSLDGGLGNDVLAGGLGNDTLDGGHGLDSLAGDQGDDRLLGGSSRDTLIGGEGTDRLDGDGTGSPDSDWLDGGAGDDTLIADGWDTLRGGGGYDLLMVGDTGVQRIQGGSGWDTVSIEGSHWNAGSAFSLGGNGVEVVSSPHGSKGIFGTVGSDRLDFSGVQLYRVAFVDGRSGNDTLLGSGAFDSLAGGDGNDSLAGEGGDDTLSGGLGQDSIDGGAGLDLIDYSFVFPAGLAIDLAAGTAVHAGQTETFVSIEGALGGYGGDTVLGSAEANLLDGALGADSIAGAEGDDTVRGGAGLDSLDGGSGSDLVDYSDLGPGSRLQLDLVAQTATVSGPGAGVESFVSFENAVGGAGKDVLLAGDGANRLDGGSGSDSIAGGGGGDILRGGEGLDTLDGGAGADTLWGGAWTDTYLVDDPGDRIFELPSEGGDLVLSRVSFTLPAEVERLVLVGEGALEATGSGDGNGLTGNDWANRLDGLSGRDRLDGLGGDDTLLGGNHDDTLIGGAGSDLLTGGTGADRFRFDSAGEGADSIADFQSGWDGIQVVSANFASLPLGTLDPSRLVAAGTALQSGDAVFIYDSASGALAFDADGNGAQAAAPIATLTGPKTLTAADIVAVAA